MWSVSAETDPLGDAQRLQLAVPPESHARQWSKQASECDRAAAAIYDPDRLASGSLEANINADVANPACALEISGPVHSARSEYQMARALLTKNDVKDARRRFEIAVSKNYRAARIDLAALLLKVSAGMLNPKRAVALYEAAWKDGVPVAAFELGHLYEYGVQGADIATINMLHPDRSEAWVWYLKGADVGEANSLARFAERDERNALGETDPSKRNALLLHAFSYYAAAAERAKDEDWPDDAWKKWRYRRATLARLLAHEGMMQQAADAYRHIYDKPLGHTGAGDGPFLRRRPMQ
jgi:TPR repeat protein